MLGTTKEERIKAKRTLFEGIRLIAQDAKFEDCCFSILFECFRNSQDTAHLNISLSGIDIYVDEGVYDMCERESESYDWTDIRAIESALLNEKSLLSLFLTALIDNDKRLIFRDLNMEVPIED